MIKKIKEKVVATAARAHSFVLVSIIPERRKKEKVILSETETIHALNEPFTQR